MKPPLNIVSSNDFQTPPIAIIPLLQYIPLEWTIWECATGQGNLVNAFWAYGYKNIIATDIQTGENFLGIEPKRQYDIIVTNPPFSLKQKFLERAYDLGKPFAFLLPLTTLETEKRQNLFQKYGLEIILFNHRINFQRPNGIEKSSSWFATAWFTWGLNIGKELNFVKLTDKY